jgi:hypothetical protein
MKKAIILLFAALQFSAVIYSNIISEEQTITYFFKHKKEAGYAYKLLDRYPKLLLAYSMYSHYTGTETGYGFYAPNVSNQAIFMFTVKDKNNQPISTDEIPFHNKDAYIRSLNVGSVYLQRPGKQDSMQNKYLNAMVKSMALWVLDTHPGAKSVEADLLIYNIATTFKDIKRNEKANYIKMDHYEYSL